LNELIGIEKAVEIITSAFAPLRCTAEPWDHGYRIRFRVFDLDEPLLTVDEILKTQFSDQARLSSILDQARSNLTNRGFDLIKWKLPINL
jgi:hypothetical protein